MPIPITNFDPARSPYCYYPFRLYGCTLFEDLFTKYSQIFHCKEVLEKHIISRMNVLLSHPERQMEVQGPKRVKDILKELQLVPEAHLVIRKAELVTEDDLIADSDEIEIRPVISGGSS